MDVEILNDTYGEGGVYVYFSEDGKNYATHFELKDYEKAELSQEYIEKLKLLGARIEIWEMVDGNGKTEYAESLVKVTQKMVSQIDRNSIPPLGKAGKLVHYLFNEVLESNSNMAFIDEEDIPFVVAELHESWESLMEGLKRDVERFHLEDVIEQGEALTAYGDLQTRFYY